MAGVVHDTAVAPSTQDRAIYGYVTPATAALIGQSTELDQLLVKIKNRGDMSDATSFANDLRDWLKANGENPLRADVVPDEHPHAGLMATMLRVLQAFAAIAFTCSAALALYMVALWMKREVRQVGIMKTIGARSAQLAAQYLGLVVPLVIVANAVALPFGTWLGRWLVRYYETVFNIDVAHWGVPPSLLLKEILCTLGIPLLAMAVPIVRAARMTAREAIQDPGITAPGGGPFSPAKWLRIPGHRQRTFAFRNIFRRPWRLAMILLALSAGGALFLTANNTYESLMRVVDVSLGNQGHDIQVQLQRPASAAQLASVARTVPEVETAEAWRTASVTTGIPGGGESQRLVLLGYPADTRLFRLPIKEGRLPAAGESDAVVINRLVQNAVPGLHPGSEVELHFRERRVKVRVVGIVEEIGIAMLYAAYPTFEAVTALGDVSSLLRIKTSPGAQESVAPALDQALLDAHLAPGNIQTSGEFRKSLEEHFAVVCDVMRMVALAAALVGAISLGASVSLNVLERAREIGVMRALGARPRAVTAIFLLEGGVVALLSGLLAVAASIVLSRGMNQMASRDLLHVAVPLHISASGLAVLGSGLLVVLAAVWLSLRRMLRISVRDALAYE